MAKYSPSPAPKMPASKPFSTPKVALGKPMTAGSAARSSASAYGKLSKMGGGKTAVPIEKM